MFDRHLHSNSAIAALNNLAKQQPAALTLLLIDGDLYQREGGWQQYEKREPGCIADYFKALLFALQDLDNQELSPEYICCLHALCAPAALTHSAGKPGQYYQPYTGIEMIDVANHAIDLPGKCKSLAGIKQHLADTKKYGRAVLGTLEINGEYIFPDSMNELSAELAASDDMQLYCPQGNKHPFYPYSIVTFLLKKFNEALENADTLDDKMRAIITHIQLLEKHHAYNDANNRTYINLLFFRCLLQHNMLPPILDNYNIFDMHSVEEIMLLVAAGMDSTRKLVENGQLPYQLPPQNDAQTNILLAEETRVFRNGMTPPLAEEFARLKHRMGYLRLANEFMHDIDELFGTVKPNEETQAMQQRCAQLFKTINDYPFDRNVATVALTPKNDYGIFFTTEGYKTILNKWRNKLLDYHNDFYANRSNAKALATFGINQPVASSVADVLENAPPRDDRCCRLQ